MNLLGCDPGFASFGWCVVKVAPGDGIGMHLAAWGGVRTEKAKGKVYAADDNVRRVQEVVRALRRVIWDHGPAVICVESAIYGPSAAKTSLVFGALATLAEVHRIPIAQAQPKEIRKVVVGRANASEEDIQRAVSDIFGAEQLFEATPKGERTHLADAMAAVVALRDSPMVRMAERLATPRAVDPLENPREVDIR